MERQNNQKGFTLIEIVVVIVIMLILEAIVFVAVSKYDSKGKNSAIKANLSSLCTMGTAYFEKNKNYDNFCFSDEGANPIRPALLVAGGELICECDTTSCDLATKWCACSKELESSGAVFCVDSSGVKKEVSGLGCNDICSAGACQ